MRRVTGDLLRPTPGSSAPQDTGALCRMLDRDGNSAPIPARSAPTSGLSLADLLDTDVPSPPDDLQHALNHNQAACKGWLVDELFTALGGRFGTVHILGGWYGVLAGLLLSDRRFSIDRVVSYDIDPSCARVAEWLNRRFVAEGRFQAVTADVCGLYFANSNGSANGSIAGGEAVGNGDHPRTLVINTSCEHIAPTAAWTDRIPSGTLIAAQSNDYFDCPEHVNCMPDLTAFKADVPMRELYYEGTLARKRYTRFMVIGRK